MCLRRCSFSGYFNKGFYVFLHSESIDNILITLLISLSYKSHAIKVINVKNFIHLLKSLPQSIFCWFGFTQKCYK